MRWVLLALSLLACTWAIPGIHVDGFLNAAAAVVIIGVVNLFLRPVLLILTLPINLLTVGLFTLVINALSFWAAGNLFALFVVDDFSAAFLGALMYTFLATIIDAIFG